VKIEDVMRRCPVIPVLVIHDPRHARPIAQALLAGGLSTIEVTMRTPAALEAISEIAGVDGVIVGAGTVLNEKHLHAAIKAGAQFIVSPGLGTALSSAAFETGTAYLPGVADASDIMRGFELGLNHFKFFPAEASGGIQALRALSGPFAEARFCPTGGITRRNAVDYLALDQVLCVGGSWLVPAEDMDPVEITNRAGRAAQLGRRGLIS
jgi:2-dehydro-3-deoxyphosphogluconate aldolase/(4S)-4-hydroxy-2-oxoglutarate aldolase